MCQHAVGHKNAQTQCRSDRILLSIFCCYCFLAPFIIVGRRPCFQGETRKGGKEEEDRDKEQEEEKEKVERNNKG